MSKEKEESFNDVEPLIADTPTVVIAGKEYKMRRLGVADTFKLAKVLAVGAAGMGKEIGGVELNAEMAIGLFIAGFPFAEREIMELFASIIGVKYADILNPSLFPMGSEIDIIQAMVGHVDVKVFFGKVVGLLNTPAIKAFLKRTSTSSKKDMEVQTKK